MPESGSQRFMALTPQPTGRGIQMKTFNKRSRSRSNWGAALADVLAIGRLRWPLGDIKGRRPVGCHSYGIRREDPPMMALPVHRQRAIRNPRGREFIVWDVTTSSGTEPGLGHSIENEQAEND